MSDPNDSRHSLSKGPVVAAALYGVFLAGVLASAAIGIALTREALPAASLAAAVAAAFAAAGLVAGTGYLAAFRRATERDARLLAAYGERMARGEYPGAPLPARADRLGEIAAALRKLGRLERALYDVRDLAVNAQGGSGRLDAQIAEALSRVSSQASRVEAASAMVERIAQATQSAQTHARRSLETAEESGQGMAGAAARLRDGGTQVTELADLATKVDEAVSLISGIADQTDILSLNAGIEAARAGPSGRGFTVVATEMRKLADKSLRSAQEISALAQSILGVVQRIAALTDEESLAMATIQRGLERMREAAGRVTADAGAAGGEVERLRAALDELASGLAESQRDVGELAKTALAVHGEVDKLRGVSSELGFPISTASFASWAAEAPEEPPEGLGRREPRPEPTQRKPAAELVEGADGGLEARKASGDDAARVQRRRAEGAEEEPAELEPVN